MSDNCKRILDWYPSMIYGGRMEQIHLFLRIPRKLIGCSPDKKSNSESWISDHGIYKLKQLPSRYIITIWILVRNPILPACHIFHMWFWSKWDLLPSTFSTIESLLLIDTCAVVLKHRCVTSEIGCIRFMIHLFQAMIWLMI